MKIRRILLTIGIFSLIVLACSPDDPDFIPVEDRDRTEQQATDRALLLEYLETHYYNSEALSSITNPLPSDIIIEELGADGIVPTGNTLLIESEFLVTRTTVFEDTEYEYYILKINQGGGDFSPNFTDNVRVGYEGSLVTDNSVFDSRVITDLNLLGQIVGWQRVFPEFNEASDFTFGSNVEYNDYGLGVMFLPSGLGFFSAQRVGIPSYSNIIFKFSLFQAGLSDEDDDSVPSYLEDLNNDLSVFNDDTDGDSFPNYLDPDDDGDGVLTIFEDLEPDSDLTVDRDGDGDPTNDIGDGDPTNDDSDNDGIPNYLDPDSTESNQEQ